MHIFPNLTVNNSKQSEGPDSMGMLGPFKNKSSGIQIMAWHQTRDKPLPKPISN